jgi:hypothetical protein
VGGWRAFQAAKNGVVWQGYARTDCLIFFAAYFSTF